MKNKIGVFLFVLNRTFRILPLVILVMTVLEALFFSNLTVMLSFIAALMAVMLWHGRQQNSNNRIFLQRLSVTETEVFIHTGIACVLCYLFMWLYQTVLLEILIKYLVKPESTAFGWKFVFNDPAFYPFFLYGNAVLIFRNTVIILSSGLLDAVNQFLTDRSEMRGMQIMSVFSFILAMALYRCTIYSYDSGIDMGGLVFILVFTGVAVARTVMVTHHGRRIDSDEEA